MGYFEITNQYLPVNVILLSYVHVKDTIDVASRDTS